MNSSTFAPDRKLIIFDADDTLWENEPLFREAEHRWADVLSGYGTREDRLARLFNVEMGNIEELGYGVKSFIINMIEAAIDITGGSLSSEQTGAIIKIGRSILSNPATPMPGVAETLAEIRKRVSCPIVMYTKGELLDQNRKARRSGLVPLFDEVIVVSRKSEDSYRALCRRFGIRPDELLSVGNSLKSDIGPVIALGGWGIHIPFHITWEHEKADPIDSPRLRTIASFPQLLELL